MVLHARPPPPHPPPPSAAICCTKAQAEAFWAPPAVTHQYPSPTGHGWGPETSDHTFPSRGPSGGLKAPARAPVPTRWVGATKQPPTLLAKLYPAQVTAFISLGAGGAPVGALPWVHRTQAAPGPRAWRGATAAPCPMDIDPGPRLQGLRGGRAGQKGSSLPKRHCRAVREEGESSLLTNRG